MTVFDEVRACEAVLDLLGDATGITIHDGEIDAVVTDDEDRVEPYAVFYPGAATTVRDQLGGESRTARWGFQVTAVGGDRQRASFAARQVAAALQDQRPVISGWVTSRITQVDAPGMSRDDDLDPPRFYTPLQFALVATIT